MPVAAAGAFGCLLVLGGGLTGRGEAAAWAAAALGTAYAAALAGGPGGLDPWAPAVAAGIVVAAEAGAWAAELRAPVRLDRTIVWARSGLLLGIGAAAAAVGLVLIAPGAGPELAGPLVTAAGVAAAVVALAVIRTVARRA
jgi:adenosylcobinamide-GDP ribazoletransferase